LRAELESLSSGWIRNEQLLQRSIQLALVYFTVREFAPWVT
jgi:hypothetical protein